MHPSRIFRICIHPEYSEYKAANRGSITQSPTRIHSRPAVVLHQQTADRWTRCGAVNRAPGGSSAPVHQQAGSASETNLGTPRFAAPNATRPQNRGKKRRRLGEHLRRRSLSGLVRHPKPRFGSLLTLCWREPDSNPRSRSRERSLGCCRREMPDR